MKLKAILLGSSLLLLTGIVGINFLQSQNKPKDNSLPSSQVSHEIETELVNIAKDSLRAEYDVQVNGDVQAALKRNPLTSRVGDPKFRPRLAKAKELRSFLASKKVHFKSFQTDLEITKVKVQGNTAIIEATEEAVLDYDLAKMASDSPKKTIERTDRRFTFTLQNGKWQLSADEILNAPGSQRNTSIPPLPIDPNAPTPTPADPLAPPSQ